MTKKSLKLTEIPPELRAAEATLFAAVNAPGRSKICQACKTNGQKQLATAAAVAAAVAAAAAAAAPRMSRRVAGHAPAVVASPVDAAGAPAVRRGQEVSPQSSQLGSRSWRKRNAAVALAVEGVPADGVYRPGRKRQKTVNTPAPPPSTHSIPAFSLAAEVDRTRIDSFPRERLISELRASRKAHKKLANRTHSLGVASKKFKTAYSAVKQKYQRMLKANLGSFADDAGEGLAALLTDPTVPKRLKELLPNLAHALANGMLKPTDVLSEAMVTEQYAQMLFEHRIQSMQKEGVDFHKYLFIPEDHPVTGGELFYHVDYHHKMKTVPRALRGQVAGAAQSQVRSADDDADSDSGGEEEDDGGAGPKKKKTQAEKKTQAKAKADTVKAAALATRNGVQQNFLMMQRKHILAACEGRASRPFPFPAQLELLFTL